MEVVRGMVHALILLQTMSEFTVEPVTLPIHAQFSVLVFFL